MFILNMSQKISEKLLSQAIEILNSGGIVIFPTDTAFGIGCRMDKKRAVERLFKIRKRPTTQAVPVLVDSIEMAKEYLKLFPKEVEDLMKKYWPGALTIVYPCQTKKVPSLVRGGGKTLGVRMPNHQTPLQLIKAIKVPILGPSANFHNMPTPYKFEDLDKNLLKLVDLAIPGECKIGLTSTVIDCSQQLWRIIRPGGVQLEESLLS